MKIFTQLLIILAINFVGEAISQILNLPIPGNIIGMILLLILLLFGIVEEKHIKETADFFLVNMGFFFIPASVGILISYQFLEGNYVKTILTILISTTMVMGITGIVTQTLSDKKMQKDESTDK